LASTAVGVFGAGFSGAGSCGSGLASKRSDIGGETVHNLGVLRIGLVAGDQERKAAAKPNWSQPRAQ
jgi:hypothetical protein